MPTILINTNLSATNVDNEEKGVQEDFKQDLNSIISKLLTKSETMNSFFIKYDIDDLQVKNSGNVKNTSTNCICERLTNLFSEVLNKPQTLITEPNQKLKTDSSQNSNIHIETKNEMKEIYSELRSIRKYQNDLSNKFNLVINKLSDRQANAHSVKTNTIDYTNLNRNSVTRHENAGQKNLRSVSNTQTYAEQKTRTLVGNNSSQILTGAKKRKHSAFMKNIQNEQDFVDSNLNQINSIVEGFKDLENQDENNELEDDNIQHLIEEDLDTENIDNEILSEKLTDDFENSGSRDCPSRLSTTTTSSKHSITKKNSNESNLGGEFNDIDEFENNPQLENNQNDYINEDMTIKNEQKDANDEIDMDGDNDGTTIEDEEYMNEYTGKDQIYPASSSSNRNGQNVYNIQLNKQSMYKLNSHGKNSNINSVYQKQYAPQMAPNQKFRFISQSPTSTSGHYQQQPYYPIPHHQTQKPLIPQNQQSRNLSMTNFSQNYLNRSEMKSVGSYPQYSNDHDNKFKSNSNVMSKTSPTGENSIKNEIATEIDINELFKNGGPRFLQMELYKNFKPPIVAIQDKFYIDNTLASSAYSKSKSRRNFAAHLAKLVFTPRERLESNCNGRFGKRALDTTLLMAIRNTLFKFYPCKQSTLIVNGDTITSGDYDENNVWLRDCIPAIDESNRVLKKQLIAWYKKNCMSNSNSANSSFSVSRSSPVTTNVRVPNYSSTPGMPANSVNEDFGDGCFADEENNLEEEFDI